MNIQEIAKLAASGEMYSQTQQIDSLRAQEILALMPRNRKISAERVDRYSELMRTHQWQANHPQALIFNKAGELIDGQHRLLAVIESGVEIDFYCTFNVDDDVKLTLDSGAARTVAQTGQIVGLETSSLDIAITKALLIRIESGFIPGALNPQALLNLFEQYKEGVQLAGMRRSSTPIVYAPIRAAIARAYYHTDNALKLERFIEVLDTGFSEGASESGAIALRNAYLNMPRKKINTRASKLALASKSLVAVQRFLKGEVTRTLGETKTQPFPLKEVDFEQTTRGD